jgi:hypothetical protein
MFKRILGLLGIGLLSLGVLAMTADAQLVASAHRIWSQVLGPANSASLVSVNLRGVYVTPGPGAAGVFLPLPGHVATLPGGVIIQDDHTFVITDVRITYQTHPGIKLNLLEMSQSLAIENVLLMEDSMVAGWQSSVGVKATGSSSEAVGVAIRKVSNGDDSPLIDIELVGYVTQQ